MDGNNDGVGSGGTGGKSTSGNVGEGGSCFALIIGNACSGSNGSTEPRGGAGGNTGNDGDPIIDTTISNLNNNSSRNQNIR